MKNQLALPLQPMSRVETVGEAKISYRRTAHPLAEISSSRDIANFLRKIWDQDTIDYVESFCVLGLSRNLKVNAYQFTALGGTTGVIADPKQIFQFALLNNASCIVVAHNHPSGNLKPSSQDRHLTEKLVSGGKILDISVIDHIIITSDGYLSFADEGLL